MFVFAILGVSFSIFALSTLVAGDPTAVVTINSLKITNNPNDYFGEWSSEITKGKRNSEVTAKTPVKAEIPDTILFKFLQSVDDEETFEYYSISFCEALRNPLVGAGLAESGTPKGEFPRECPLPAGDWGLSKFEIPSDPILPGFPDGPVKGAILIMEEGKEPYIKIEFEAELSHGLPELPSMMG